MRQAEQSSSTPRRYIDPYKKYVGVHIPNWLVCRTEISHGAKIVWGRLAQFAGKNKTAFPYISTLSKEVGLGERQTRACLNELVKFDLIEGTDRRAESKSTVYKFLDHPWSHEDDYDDAAGPSGGILPDPPAEDEEGDRIEQNPAGPSGGILPDPPAESCRTLRRNPAGVYNEVRESEKRIIVSSASPSAQAATSKAKPAGKKKSSKPQLEGLIVPGAEGLKNEYFRKRNLAGCRHTSKMERDGLVHFEKCVAMCEEVSVQPTKFLEYLIQEFPKFAKGQKFVPTSLLVSDSMLNQFLAYDPKSAPSSSSAHPSVALEKNHEDYPAELASRFLSAGLSLPEKKSSIGRIVNDAKNRAAELPHTQGLPWGRHVHACLCAAYDNPAGLRAWIVRDVDLVQEQWQDVVSTALRLVEEDGDRFSVWEPLFQIYQEVGAK